MKLVIRDGTKADGGEYLSAGAAYSECSLYRYLLWRRWGEERMAMFIMLNPSTATHLVLDPTLRRCKAYATAWGYGGFVVGNLFAFRATEPRDMKHAVDPFGPNNHEIVAVRAQRAIERGGIVVAGWGTHGTYANACYDLRGAFRRRGIPMHYLKKTADGHPCHPLYLRSSLTPQEWV